MISYFLLLNPDFDSLPNDEKWTYVSTLNNPHSNYVLAMQFCIQRFCNYK